MSGRAFPGDAEQVAALTRAAVEGYRGTRVAATVKHFPGLGGASENTDDDAGQPHAHAAAAASARTCRRSAPRSPRACRW